MTEEQKLMKAMIASPRDDLLRLAYADLMEELGRDPCIAEVIRYQVGTPVYLGECEEDPDVGIYCYPSAPCSTCSYLNGIRGVPWDLLCRSKAYVMNRGFLQAIHCTPADWIVYGKQVANAHPVEAYVPYGFAPINVKRKGGGSRTWAWFKRETYEDLARNCCLPDELMPLPRRRTNHHTEPEAYRAVSNRALAWARES